MRGNWTGVIAVMLAASAPAAFADVNQTPIAVPLLGTEGPASPYPSRITVAAHGGPNQASRISVRLWGLSHPCAEDLAMLLVHDNAARYLLMSNAGGCRPFQGTNLRISDDATSTIPDTNPLASPPYGESVWTQPANYGVTPTFPAPAPAGGFVFVGLPPANTNVNGTWDLYVLDTGSGNRGVIAAGWTLMYDTNPEYDAVQSNISVPGAGTSGVAEHYPITFNLNGVLPGRLAYQVILDVTMGHQHPDDLRMALQNPQGTTVILMANAGGPTDIPGGTTIRFSDGTSNDPMPDAGPINDDLYQPGGAYGGAALAAPAPQPPYATEFEAFEGQPARGTWRLWAYDDAALNVGAITSATLTIYLEPLSPGQLSFPNLPVGAFTTDQPFVRYEGTVANEIFPSSLYWRNVVDGTFYDVGPILRRPGTNQVYADVPVKKGTNSVSTWILGTSGLGSGSTRPITVNEFTYSLAEGATGGFFDFDLTLANPTAAAAPVAIDFLAETGGVVHVADSVAATSPLQLNVETYLPATAMSTIVRSTDAVPLAVERTMSWDARGYGGHGGTSVAPALRWFFAEGSQGYFQTYVLLANDNASAVDITVEFLLEGGGVISAPVSVPATSRHTIYAGGIPELVDRSFGIAVNASQPIIAERAMYLPGPHLFEGGHESAGVTAMSRNWFLAEGATGPFFDCFVLMSNPNNAAANVTLTYLLPSGATVVQNVIVPANSRKTINVETVDTQLANTPVSTTIISDVAIVAERAMYWPDIGQGWQEAHNSFGVTDTGLRWGIADGRIGGARAHQTYILLANPNPQPAEVEVRFLKPGFSVSRSYTLPPTSRLNIWANGDVPELGEGTFSADVRVVNYQPIVVEKALYWNAEGVTWAGGTNVTATRLPTP